MPGSPLVLDQGRRCSTLVRRLGSRWRSGCLSPARLGLALPACGGRGRMVPVSCGRTRQRLPPARVGRSGRRALPVRFGRCRGCALPVCFGRCGSCALPVRLGRRRRCRLAPRLRQLGAQPGDLGVQLAAMRACQGQLSRRMPGLAASRRGRAPRWPGGPGGQSRVVMRMVSRGVMRGGGRGEGGGGRGALPGERGLQVLQRALLGAERGLPVGLRLLRARLPRAGAGRARDRPVAQELTGVPLWKPGRAGSKPPTLCTDSSTRAAPSALDVTLTLSVHGDSAHSTAGQAAAPGAAGAARASPAAPSPSHSARSAATPPARRPPQLSQRPAKQLIGSGVSRPSCE